MDAIKIKDKDFAVSIPESKILCEVERLAAQISRDLEGKNPLFLGSSLISVGADSSV